MKAFNAPQFYNGFCCYFKSNCSNFDKVIKLFTSSCLHPFVFYVDHMALVYLVNKPQDFGKIVRWILLFLEYDFKIVYKLNRFHQMVDALSRLPNKRKLVGVLD